ncbi:hypothetical protein ACLBWT_10405 [Paenibacillus sp. D51F]
MSDAMNVSRLLELLEARKGEDVDIVKQEDGDWDKVRMTFSGAELLHNPSPDDYVSGTILLLHGSASIVTDKGREPVPGDSYEIPLQADDSLIEQDGEIRVQTKRATYSIQPSVSAD